MVVYLCDENFREVQLIDDYKSLIWTERYDKPGDFEIELSQFTTKYINSYDEAIGLYLYNPESNTHMIIEQYETKYDIESGPSIIFTGRSLSSILDRRIIWNQTLLSGNIQNQIIRLLNDAIINPSIANRKIEGFSVGTSEDPFINSTSIQAQFTGDNLLEAIQQICEAYGLGFKISHTSNNRFLFELINGTDRSNFVIFSQNNDNLISTDVYFDESTRKTVTLVAGEGEGNERKTYPVDLMSSSSGLDRKEMFTDARDLSTNDGEISLTEYFKQLNERGLEDLSENTSKKTFAAEVDNINSYKINNDYFIGDILFVTDAFDFSKKVRVTEFIYSQNNSDGIQFYPSFTFIDDNYGISTSSYVDWDDVVDQYTGSETDKSKIPTLKALDELMDNVNTKLDEKVDKVDITDNLSTNDMTKVLSAKQGKELKSEVDKKVQIIIITQSEYDKLPNDSTGKMHPSIIWRIID